MSASDCVRVQMARALAMARALLSARSTSLAARSCGRSPVREAALPRCPVLSADYMSVGLADLTTVLSAASLAPLVGPIVFAGPSQPSEGPRTGVSRGSGNCAPSSSTTSTGAGVLARRVVSE